MKSAYALFVLMSVALPSAGAWAQIDSPITITPSAVTPVAPPATIQPRSLASYKIGSGDRLRIDVFGEPDLSIDTAVESNGSINYPLLGRLRVVGLTAKELEQVIIKGLKGDFLIKPDVRISLVTYRPIYVIGQVRRAGSYPYVEGINVEKALALAGGMTDLASVRQIFILREDNQTYLREKAGLETVVLPGDTVIIEEGWF